MFLHESYLHYVSISLQNHTSITSQDKQQSQQQDQTKPFLHVTGFIVGYLQCMIIDTHDGQYKDIIKAVPMEKVADSSTGDTATITSDTRKDVVVIQEYIERDPRKQLFSIHDDSNDQKSKQFYLKKN